MNKSMPADHDSVQVAESAHRRAMELVDAAFLARRSGDSQKEREYNLQALEEERQAANAIAEFHELEPSRSVLYRSAATLAYRCDKLREAERLAACALSGKNAPPEIVQEVRELMEDINCQRHHESHGIELQPNELYFRMAGPAIGHGFAQVNLVKFHVDRISKLLYQTMSRVLGVQSKESMPKSISNAQSIFVSVPVAGSYGINFRIGTMQHSLPGIDQSVPGLELSGRVIDEFLTCIEFVNTRDVDGLRGQILDANYSQKFLSLSKEIAPDGDAIHSVEFAAHLSDTKRIVTFATPRAMLKQLEINDSEMPNEDQVEIRGVLLQADAKKQKTGSIQVVDSSKKHHTIRVSRDSMGELVQEMFETHVDVTARKVGKSLELIRIDQKNLPNN